MANPNTIEAQELLRRFARLALTYDRHLASEIWKEENHSLTRIETQQRTIESYQEDYPKSESLLRFYLGMPESEKVTFLEYLTKCGEPKIDLPEKSTSAEHLLRYLLQINKHTDIWPTGIPDSRSLEAHVCRTTFWELAEQLNNPADAMVRILNASRPRARSIMLAYIRDWATGNALLD